MPWSHYRPVHPQRGLPGTGWAIIEDFIIFSDQKNTKTGFSNHSPLFGGNRARQPDVCKALDRRGRMDRPHHIGWRYFRHGPIVGLLCRALSQSAEKRLTTCPNGGRHGSGMNGYVWIGKAD